MRKLLLPLVLALTLASCRKPVPEGILPKDKMVLLLTDLQLADAATRKHLMPEAYERMPEKYLLEITANHGTDTATFRRSMQWYMRHPEQLDKIYAGVNDALMKQPLNP